MADACFQCTSVEESVSCLHRQLYVVQGLHNNRVVRVSAGPKRIADGHSFQRVADRRTCTVGFEIPGERHVESVLSVRILDELLLHLFAWLSKACATVLVRGRGSDDRTDCIAIPHCGIEWFDDKNAESFASTIAICAVVKRMAHAIGRKKAKIGETHEIVWNEE